MIAGCKNKYCEEYKNNTCRRAVRNKEAIAKRETYVVYIPERNQEKACELFLKRITK